MIILRTSAEMEDYAREDLYASVALHSAFEALAENPSLEWVSVEVADGRKFILYTDDRRVEVHGPDLSDKVWN